jgi:putative effector of murein hydrolase
LVISVSCFIAAFYLVAFFDKTEDDKATNSSSNDLEQEQQPTDTFRRNDTLCDSIPNNERFSQAIGEAMFLDYTLTRGSNFATDEFSVTNTFFKAEQQTFDHRISTIQSNFHSDSQVQDFSRFSVNEISKVVVEPILRNSTISKVQNASLATHGFVVYENRLRMSIQGENIVRPSEIKMATMTSNINTFRNSSIANHAINSPIATIKTDISRKSTTIKEVETENDNDGEESVKAKLREISISSDAGDIAENNIKPIALPFIPNIDQIFETWKYILILTTISTYLSPTKTESSVIAFQISISVLVFIVSTSYRMKVISCLHYVLQNMLQTVFIFVPIVIVFVLLSSIPALSNGTNSLKQYKVEGNYLDIASYGAGNYIAIFINPVIVSLAFPTVEPIIKYYRLLPFLIPIIFFICALILLQSALLAYVLQSPSTEIAYPMITHTVTTPIALAIAALTGANTNVVAATSVLNGVLSLRLAPIYLDYMKIKNPVTRGVSAGISGTLLGVVALDERGETAAAGIGMAGYGIATVCFAVLMAIPPFRVAIIGLS